MKGLRSGKIDCSDRERDPQIEQNRGYAVKGLEFVIETLRNLPQELLEIKAAVRSEVDAGLWLESSAARELEFLYSYTVQHHALVAEKLKRSGIEIEADFGVAPSTLEFGKEKI